jgi:transposase
MSMDHRYAHATAIPGDDAAIYVSLELSQSSWLITALLPGAGKLSRHGVAAGDAAGLLAHLAALRDKAFKRTGAACRLIAIQEAGLDGFWLHRLLVAEGIDSHVVDAASIAVPRRRRRAKTDRIDGELLLRTLLAWRRGEPRVCSMVQVPTVAEEDRRRLSREYKALVAERVRHGNRIKGLLLGQGVRDYVPLRGDRRDRLAGLRTGDGRALPPHLAAQIGRELDRIELLLDQIKAVQSERQAMLAAAGETVGEAAGAGAARPAVPTLLLGLRGIGIDFAATLWSEGLYRPFANRRQLGAYAGLTPSPWRSGALVHEQGISKAGNPRLRTTAIQLAWLWLRHQPDSALARWFHAQARCDRAGWRKKAIVALARKLLVALWKYVHHGVVIEGAVTKAAATA